MAKEIVLITQGKLQYLHIITGVAERRGLSPYIDEDGYWVIYDDETRAWVTTDVYARGNIGPQGEKGETGDDYILTPEDVVDIANLINERELDVVKAHLHIEPSVSDGMLLIGIGTAQEAETGSQEVVVSVGEITPDEEDDNNG